MTTKLSLALFASLAVGVSKTDGAVLISQYYEGASNDKYIELVNTDPSNAVNMSALGYILTLWTNANAEGYKNDAAPSVTFTLAGTIPAGGNYLLSHTSAATPTYATPDIRSSTAINFNGNDSVAISTGPTFSTANLIDAVGFTNTGNEGQDKSFVRISESMGYSTAAGSEITDFPSVWQLFTNAQVNTAIEGTPERLVAAVPEPTGIALFGLGAVGLLRRRSRHS